MATRIYLIIGIISVETEIKAMSFLIGWLSSFVLGKGRCSPYASYRKTLSGEIPAAF